MKRIVVLFTLGFLLCFAANSQARGFYGRYYYGRPYCHVRPVPYIICRPFVRVWVPGYWAWNYRRHRRIWIAGYYR